MQLSMRALGISKNQPVLTNAFTLSPVPGSIHAAGGSPVLVESTEDLVIDLDHLEARIKASGSKVLMISHMRGHIVDMDALTTLLSAMTLPCSKTARTQWAPPGLDARADHTDEWVVSVHKPTSTSIQAKVACWSRMTLNCSPVQFFCQGPICCTGATARHLMNPIFPKRSTRHRTAVGGWTTCVQRF